MLLGFANFATFWLTPKLRNVPFYLKRKNYGKHGYHSDHGDHAKKHGRHVEIARSWPCLSP